MILSRLSGTEIYMRDKSKEAVENKMSDARLGSVTILGIKILFRVLTFK